MHTATHAVHYNASSVNEVEHCHQSHHSTYAVSKYKCTRILRLNGTKNYI